MANKKKQFSLIEEINTFDPVFDPPIMFDQGVDHYKGTLTLHPLLVFNVSANRQGAVSKLYGVRGTVSLRSPENRYLLQPENDKLAEIKEKRQKAGQKELSSKHSFASAAKRELNVKRVLVNTPEQKDTRNETAIDNAQEENWIDTHDYSQAIINEAIKKAHELIAEFEPLINRKLVYDVPVTKMPLSSLLRTFGNSYLNNRTSSDAQKDDYRRKIESVSNIMGFVPVGELNEKKLLKLAESHPTLNHERLTEVNLFLDYIAMYRGISNPLGTIIPAVINKLPKPRNTDILQGKAIATPFIPERVETEINHSLLNVFEPLSAGFVLIKEGRLMPEEVCNAKFDMLDISSNEPNRVFFLLRKDRVSGATHDYRFPLLPFGAYYVLKYIEHLKKTYGTERVGNDRYILSNDPDGKTPIEPDQLKEFCRTEIGKYKFGYAALAGLSTSRTPKAVTLLHNTYDTRLAEACRLRNDHGAMLFMKHTDLAQSVQADCYRGFTDKTGMDYLYRSTQHDQRGVPKVSVQKPTRRSTRADKETPGRTIAKFPAVPDGFPVTLEIALQGLKVGDIVTVNVENGCFVTVLSPE